MEPLLSVDILKVKDPRFTERGDSQKCESAKSVECN